MSAVNFKDALVDTVFPQFLIDLGFQDQSWHNDAAAQARYRLKGGNNLVVWVAPEKVEDREYTGQTRFAICVYDKDYEDCQELLLTDDADQCRLTVQALVQISKWSVVP